MFIQSGDVYRHLADGQLIIAECLPAGAYTVDLRMDGMYFIPSPITGDPVIRTGTVAEMMVEREVNDFFNYNITSDLRSARLKHRRGILLYGEVGCGKTSLIRMMTTNIINSDAIVLIEPNVSYIEHAIIPVVRQSDPDRPIAIIWDEFDDIVEDNEDVIVRLLDGVNSPDDIIVLATTNDIDLIPEKIRDRPSRFSLVLEVPVMSPGDRTMYASTKYHMLDGDDILFISKLTEGRSIDITEEACKLKLMGYTRQAITERMILTGLIEEA